MDFLEFLFPHHSIFLLFGVVLTRIYTHKHCSRAVHLLDEYFGRSTEVLNVVINISLY